MKASNNIYQEANSKINQLMNVKPTNKRNTMKTATNKTATNYIHAEQYLKEYKEHLQTKYGRDFKGSQLTDSEIDTLCFYKEQLRNHSITVDQYVTRAI